MVTPVRLGIIQPVEAGPFITNLLTKSRTAIGLERLQQLPNGYRGCCGAESIGETQSYIVPKMYIICFLDDS